jgi:hypothetical protein
LTEQSHAKDGQHENQHQQLTSTFPQPRDQLPKIPIKTGPFWSTNNNNYEKFRNYEL